MRNSSGWVAGALGVGALVAAFFLGGRLAGSGTALPPAGAGAETAAVLSATGTSGAAAFAVECEPGQRAVVRTTPGGAPSVACVSEARPVADATGASYAPLAARAPDVVRVAGRDDRPYARPAVLTEPVEVYRPRARRVSDDTREAAAPRTVKKSVAIIAGSTAAGAVVGGLVKGGKGAVVGGLLGGGAATVWDQVTRRQHANR